MRNGLNIAWGIVMVAGLAVPAGAVEGEKLLFGFEREEVEKVIQSKKASRYKRDELFKEQENGDFEFFRFEGGCWHQEMRAIRPMHYVKERKSQGEYSCKTAEMLDKYITHYPTFRSPRIYALPLCLNTPQENMRRPEILNTSGWYDWAFPRDWSGYDCLRVDVWLKTGEASGLMLEIEDDLVEPPVSLTYEEPSAGKWMTLEMDLARAAEERALDLKSIRNLWVRVILRDMDKNAREMHDLVRKRDRIKKKGGDDAAYKKAEKALLKRQFVAYVDNVRLCMKDMPASHEVLKGARSVYTQQLPRSYGVWDKYDATEKEVGLQKGQWPMVIPADVKMPKPADVKPDTGPIDLKEPSVIPIREMILKGVLDKGDKLNRTIHNYVRLTCTAARDPKRIVVGFYLLKMGSLKAHPGAKRTAARHCGAAVATVDGGTTWKGADGTDWPSSLGGNISKPFPRPVDIGGDVMGVFPFGCGGLVGAHIGYPADRTFFVRTAFMDDLFWVSPKYLITGDTRHCHDVRFADAVETPSGRIWSGWSAADRSCYGRWASREHSTYMYYSDDGGAAWTSWRGTGLVGTIPNLGKEIRLVPYRGHVAAFGSKYWTWFDGEKWAERVKTRWSRRCWHATALGEEIYIGDESGPIKWYDGKVWSDFTAPGRTGKRGKIGVCGRQTLVFVETDESGKKLLCWRKKEGGPWNGPQTLIEEKTKIVKVAHQRYAPRNFIPIAYQCSTGEEPSGKKKKRSSGVFYGFPDTDPVQYEPLEPWIKVLKVPAEG